MPKFETKNTILGIFDKICLILVFFCKNFKKAIVKSEISIHKFFYFQNFLKNQKA